MSHSGLYTVLTRVTLPEREPKSLCTAGPRSCSSAPAQGCRAADRDHHNPQKYPCQSGHPAVPPPAVPPPAAPGPSHRTRATTQPPLLSHPIRKVYMLGTQRRVFFRFFVSFLSLSVLNQVPAKTTEVPRAERPACRLPALGRPLPPACSLLLSVPDVCS